jgi:hypothetical protein
LIQAVDLHKQEDSANIKKAEPGCPPGSAYVRSTRQKKGIFFVFMFYTLSLAEQ